MSSSDPPPDSLGDLLNQSANLRTLEPAAVGSQVALMAIISAVTIVVFNILRPRNKIIYEPKVKYHVGNKPPPRISDSLFGWVSPVLHVKEPELIDKIGLDAAMFLRFLRMMRWLFTCIALFTCAALLPVNITFNLSHVDSKDRDALSMLTIRDVTGNLLFVHVAATYGVSAIVMGFVWYHWKVVVSLRRQWFRSPEYMQSFYARTLMLNDVPRKLQSDEGIRAIFDSTQAPYPTTSVHIGRSVGKLPELIEFHNQAVRELEHNLVKYLKNGRIGKKRPTIRIGGFLGMGGKKMDAIDYYTAKLQRTEAAVEQYRSQIDTNKAEKYGFASMAAVPYAHIVANMLRRKKVKGTIIHLAPNPKDIIWENLNKSKSEIRGKQVTGWLFIALVCFFNTVPLFIISVLANLASLTKILPVPFGEWSEKSRPTFTLVSGVLPPAVSALFGLLFPIVMRWLTQYMGAMTHSRLDRAVIARYFAFLVISQLIIFTLIGVIFNSVKEIIGEIGEHKNIHEILSNINRLPGLINRTYIDQSSYWLTYFPLRGFLAVFDLAQIINLLWLSFKTHVFGRTPRDIREWTQPPEFQYPILYSNMLFMGCVGLVFAPLAPLVAVAAAVVLWMSSWVYKYQLMFVYITRVETGGRIWNVVINRLLISVILMQLLVILTIGLQYGFDTLYWISTIPPILLIVIFKMYCSRVFNASFNFYIPNEQELRLAQVHSKRADNAGNRLEKRFGHPSLTMDLFTPMLHANQMELLPQVFQGKIGNTKTKMDEYGGTKMDARIVAGGIKIAGIEQADLEYDPVLYQRDRGELDWDARSVSSTNLLDDKTVYNSRSTSPAPSKALDGYNRYLQHGATQSSDIELTRLDQVPLLTGTQPGGYFDPSASATTLASAYQSPQMEYAVPNVPPPMPYSDYREAPIHRPYPSRQGTMDGSQSQIQNVGGGYAGESNTNNMAGRGTGARAASPGPYDAYDVGGRGRTTSPGPYDAYGGRGASARTGSPGPYDAYDVGRGGGGGGESGNMAGRGAHRS
ncbi:hypothetical protein EIP91_000978 [Steccherinum ochraceum]|uniref:DUF221-domain-containing protein n=1 Tax=Steccherinum ochraceum TaxID=92696 RepID=A0A4V2MWL6_9APHY|nr:hypothetical protein EIP91_000978 [Steccherinum ochraceum]